MSKLKVINIISDTNIGGAGKCILTFAQNYDREKIDLSVIVPKGSMLKPECEKLNVECIEAKSIADESMNISAILSMKKLIKSLSPDVVHTHAALSARIAARLAGVGGIVYTRHCVYEPTKFMISPLGKLINKIVSNLFCDKIIAVAEAAAQNLCDVGISKNRIEVILNGITPLTPLSDEEKCVQRERFGVLQSQMVVSIIARIEEVKGHKYFIEVANILRDKGVNAKFIAAGTGSVEQALKKNSGNVQFCGFITDAYNLVGITDISVNCSFGTEATSISLLEGMSLGIPAVVTNFGGNPGVIQDGINGLLVPTHDSVSMACAIEALINNKELYKSMSQNSIRIFNEKFTAEAMTKQIQKVYYSLVKCQ